MLARVGISLGHLSVKVFAKLERDSEAIAMSEPDFQQFDPPPEVEKEDSPELMAQMDFEQWLEVLQKSDRSFYNLMAMEVWSIAKTMDGLLPGFWTRFMSHRQTALKQFLRHKQAHADADSTPPSSEH
ncbi:hypothetical protein H6F90_29125 [Trichocoleus sp. FACHB-591]|nr:hypothetical protein [Trichocoleus sp. FACHB-591]